MELYHLNRIHGHVTALNMHK